MNWPESIRRLEQELSFSSSLELVPQKKAAILDKKIAVSCKTNPGKDPLYVDVVCPENMPFWRISNNQERTGIIDTYNRFISHPGGLCLRYASLEVGETALIGMRYSLKYLGEDYESGIRKFSISSRGLVEVQGVGWSRDVRDHIKYLNT